MAATNFTPIILYHSTTASAAPTSGNLNNGELAINITDGKLFYKDNGGTVQVIATKGTGTIGGSDTQVQYNSSGALAGSSNFTFNGTTATINTLNLTNALAAAYGGTGQSSYTTGDIIYATGATALSKLTIGANTTILTSNGSAPQWSAASAISVNTATNLAGGAAGSLPYQSGAGATTFLSIGSTNRVLTSSGSAPQWVTALSDLTGVSSNIATLGGSGFTLPAVLSVTAPAKLYINTSTVTDGSSAIGATNTLGAITSFGGTTVAATNANVTYTNLGTLVINAAPTAGTNVTITNPYALYVAAGASYFGSTVTVNGTVNATTLDLTNLEVTNIKAKDGTAAIVLTDATGAVTISTALTANGGAVFNENGADVDFRVEGDTDANLLFADASADAIGIGTSSPAAKLDVATASGDCVIRVGNGTSQARYAVDSDGPYIYPLTSGDLSLRVFTAAGSQALTIDTSGNLGLGVTPSAWRQSGDRALQIGSWMSLFTDSNLTAELSSNVYITSSSTYTYQNTGFATRYRQYQGAHEWLTASSGTANTTTITNGVSYIIITSGNQTAFGAANNNVGTVFTATSGGTLSSGTVSQNIGFSTVMTLDASGNLLVGDTTNPDSRRLRVYGISEFDGNGVGLSIYKSSGTKIGSAGQGDYIVSGGPADGYGIQSQTALVFGSGGTTERARITSGGYFKASNTGTYNGSTGTYHEFRNDVDTTCLLASTSSTGANVINMYSQLPASANASALHFVGVISGSGVQFQVDADGDVKNTNNSYGSISDVKLKQDIVDAASQWDDIKNLRVRKYRLKSNPDKAQIGLVAQEAETVSPGLIDEHPDFEEVEVPAVGEDGQPLLNEDGLAMMTKERRALGTSTKAVKYSVLYMKSVKALQEAMARIEQLEAKVAALELKEPS